MKQRIFFWFITLLAIWGAFSTYNVNPLPPAYAKLAPPTAFDSPENIAAGREIFLANCAACHGLAGNGQGTIKPTFGPPPADFTDRARQRTQSPQYLFWRVSEGGQVEPFRSQGSIMPAWKFRLSETERWQVVAYLRTLAP